MVLVTDTQAQTISAQAADYLRKAEPIQIPGSELTQAFADQLNNQLEGEIGPLLEQLRVSLRLDVQNQMVDGTHVVVIKPHAVKPDRSQVAGVFAHGGGWALLTGNDYNAYRMAHDLGIIVYSVDYSRSPRAQFPVALNETFAAYHAVTQNHRKVVVAGSSAGGNLLITTILKARRGEARPPEAAGLFTPLVDLRGIGDSYVANDGRDPLVTRDTITKLSDAYLGTASTTDPAASPILADYSDGFVPAILTTGTRDLLQSDSVRFYWKLHEAGARVRLRVWEGMGHAFESVPCLPGNPSVPCLPEGEQNMREVFGFLEEHL
jgi:epsilon-lactone hydrolase